MLGKVNVNPSKKKNISALDAGWSYINTSGKSINIPFGNVDGNYIDKDNPFLVNDIPSNGINIPPNAIVKLNINKNVTFSNKNSNTIIIKLYIPE